VLWGSGREGGQAILRKKGKEKVRNILKGHSAVGKRFASRRGVQKKTEEKEKGGDSTIVVEKKFGERPVPVN